jgi:hypothetical protein
MKPVISSAGADWTQSFRPISALPTLVLSSSAKTRLDNQSPDLLSTIIVISRNAAVEVCGGSSGDVGPATVSLGFLKLFPRNLVNLEVVWSKVSTTHGKTEE